MNLWTILWFTALSLTFMILSVVQAFQGDWQPAIWFAILWVGLTNNTNASVSTWAITQAVKGEPLTIKRGR